MEIQVFFNMNRDHRFLKYHEGDEMEAGPVIPVELLTEKTTEGSVGRAKVRREVWSLLNAPIEYLPTVAQREFAKDYHTKFRSLSVGDLIQIDGRRYAVESCGFTEVWDAKV